MVKRANKGRTGGINWLGTTALAQLPELTSLPLADDREKTGEGTLVDGNLLRAGLWGMGVPLMAKLGHPGMMAAGTTPSSIVLHKQP